MEFVRTNIDQNLRARDEYAAPLLPPPQRHCQIFHGGLPKGSSAEHMYRIVRDSIANAVKHANAERISVTLKASETKLVLTVLDDGDGIEETRTTGGIGLQIMRYRARLLGGLLDVRRSSSGGTIVRSVLPRCGDPIK